MSKKKSAKKKAKKQTRKIIVPLLNKLRNQALTMHHVRILPPPSKVWDRGAVFAKHELDTIEGLAKYLLRVRKHLDGVSIQAARDVLKILSTKKI